MPPKKSATRATLHPERKRPGQVRDAILAHLTSARDASVEEIHAAVSAQLGDVPTSSVRSYLRLNTPGTFQRTGRGRYRLNQRSA
jgi:site-specific DNA-methyltransferase (adenine-specific)